MELKPGQHVHFMGICGTAMASLAGLLKDRGLRVTGSDQNPYPPMSTQLEKLQIPIFIGYRAENLNPKPDGVIVGNVISADNPEAMELQRLQIPFTSLPKAMGEFIIEDRACICISGTHGKTTTTSLMAWVSEMASLKPGFLIGGIPKNFSQSFKNPQGSLFVIEGDEYDTAYFDKVPKFVHYKPKHVILTSVEFDHADIYADLNAVKKAFAQLMRMIPRDGSLIAWAEDPLINELKTLTNTQQVFGYGFNQGDYRCQVLEVSPTGTNFRVTLIPRDSTGKEMKAQILGDFIMPLSGNYNVLNATAVIAQAHLLKIDMALVQTALRSFLGVKRRQEILGEPGGVLVIEDFAHHPTAVRETLKGLRGTYPQRRIWAIFEPRSATSRRKIFQKEYASAFRGADRILLARAFDQSKIKEEDRFSSDDLVADLRKLNQIAEAFSQADDIVDRLGQEAKAGDVVVIMSNGGFDGIYQKLIKKLEART